MMKASRVSDFARPVAYTRGCRRAGVWATVVLMVTGVFGFSRFVCAGPQEQLRAESPLPLPYFQGRPLSIGNQIQLLVYDYLVEDRWKLQRRVGRVNKFMRNPVIVQDKPWEDAVGAYPSVLYDERLGKYRMWYQCFNLSNYFSKEGPSYYVGYAESEDAFNWTVILPGSGRYLAREMCSTTSVPSCSSRGEPSRISELRHHRTRGASLPFNMRETDPQQLSSGSEPTPGWTRPSPGDHGPAWLA